MKGCMHLPDILKDLQHACMHACMGVHASMHGLCLAVPVRPDPSAASMHTPCARAASTSSISP